MVSAVFDSTVLVSAFLAKTGISAALLHFARDGTFEIVLADEILEETQRVLLETERIRRRYHYTDQSVVQYTRGLRAVSSLVMSLPHLHGITRDPNDDMVVACALKGKAHYIVTRDKDLLVLNSYKGTEIITPEAFKGVVGRKYESR